MIFAEEAAKDPPYASFPFHGTENWYSFESSNDTYPKFDKETGKILNDRWDSYIHIFKKNDEKSSHFYLNCGSFAQLKIEDTFNDYTKNTYTHDFTLNPKGCLKLYKYLVNYVINNSEHKDYTIANEFWEGGEVKKNSEEKVKIQFTKKTLHYSTKEKGLFSIDPKWFGIANKRGKVHFWKRKRF
jgi:hypothetical protein